MIYDFMHSYWSVPAFCERWNIDKITQTITNMWYFALSVEYLKNLGQRIDLHTDEFGKDLLDHIPYDNIYLTLESIPKWMDPSIWACGKMYALKQVPIGTTHIDGDVFFKKAMCLSKLNQQADVITQCYENTSGAPAYTSAMSSLQHLEFPNWATKTFGKSCNTGVLCFKNEYLKNDFLDAYFAMAEKISNDSKCKNKFSIDKSIAPDIIIEQKFLYELSSNQHYKMGVILDNKSEAIDIGYQHVIGVHKYPQLNSAKEVLKKLNYDLFKQCEQKEREFINWMNNADRK